MHFQVDVYFLPSNRFSCLSVLTAVQQKLLIASVTLAELNSYPAVKLLIIFEILTVESSDLF